MKIDYLGLPQIEGSSDLQDSAMFAGMLTLFGVADIPVEKYVDNGVYVRHPKEIKYDFSRDQAICLIAGLWKKGLFSLVNKDFVTGKDIFSPSVQGHFLRCQGKQASWYHNMWLRADILFHAKCKPLSESNQLICMMMVAGPEYVRLWKRMNKDWNKSISYYWCGWRDESDLSNNIIATISLI